MLLVEYEPDDLRQYERDFPSVVASRGIEAVIHSCRDFEDAYARTSSPLYRYDFIVSDTYRGSAKAIWPCCRCRPTFGRGAVGL